MLLCLPLLIDINCFWSNQFSRHSSPWNTTRSDAEKATSQDPSLEGWSYTILNVLYITRIYGEMRPAVVLTKMTEMHHVCEVDYQGRCDGHQWDGPGLKGESLRAVPKPAGYNVTLKWSTRISTVSSFQNLLASFWFSWATLVPLLSVLLEGWSQHITTYISTVSQVLSLEGSFTGLVEAAQANGEKIATYTGVMQVGTWGSGGLDERHNCFSSHWPS